MRRSARRAAASIATLALGVAFANDLPDDLQTAAALLQPLQRAALKAHATMWAAWSPAQRDAFAARADAWDRLPIAQRAERRADWQAFHALPATERAQLEQAAARVAALDPAAQAALRAEFDALDASARHGWRLGPVLGVDYPRLQPLLAQVPADEGAGLIRALRAMTPDERDKLAVLVQRTPPTARDALRRELVSTSDANRAAWLLARLDR